MSTNKYLECLLGIGVHHIAHSGGALLLHLMGTKEILEYWNADEDLCVAGLFHAVYGTNSFHEGPLKPDSHGRKIIEDCIGREAEMLVYEYSRTSLSQISIELLSNQRYRELKCERSMKVLVRLLNLVVANEVEQHARMSIPMSKHTVNLANTHRKYLLDGARKFMELF